MRTVRLVALEEEHLPPLLRTMRDDDVLRFTRTPDPMPDGWLQEWLAAFDGRVRACFAIVDAEGSFLGYAVTGPIDWEGSTVELGYAVSPWARGRGVATAALRELTGWALDQGMQRVTALISVDNTASSRVAEKVGFTLEGVLRSVYHSPGRRGDMQSWSMLSSERPS